MGLSETEYERFFGGVGRVEGLLETAEDFLVFVLVFFGKDDEGGGSEAVLQRSEAALLFAGFGFGSAFGAVAAVGGELSW